MSIVYRWHFIQSDYSRISGISVARNMLVTSYAKSIVVNGVLRRMTLAVNGLLWRATIVTEGLIVPFVAAMIIAFAKWNRRVVFLPPSLPRIVFPGKWNRKSGDRERSPYVSVLRGSKGEVKLMELMFSERGVAFLGRVGHLGWIFELDGRFWQRGRVRHHSDREAYTLPSDLVPSWHPKSRRFPLVARQRGRGECT